MNPANIAIIILHYKNLDDTRECLRSIKNINYPSSLPPPPLLRRGSGGGSTGGYRVLVVNNDSVNQGQILKNEFSDFITLIQNQKNLGFSEGNNVGIRAALADKTTDAVLILNNDTIVDANILREMTKSLQTLTLSSPLKGEGTIGMVAPRMMQYRDKGAVDNLGIQLMSSGLPFNRRSAKDKLFCPTGGAALYTRKLLETVGLFDPRFYAYAEDLDLGFRARLMGFTAEYSPNAIVFHKGSAATAAMSDFAVYHTYRNLIWTQYKNFPSLLLLWQSPWLALGWLFILALYIKKGQTSIILRALWDGLTGLKIMAKYRQAVQRQRRVTQKEILAWLAPGLFPKNLLR